MRAIFILVMAGCLVAADLQVSISVRLVPGSSTSIVAARTIDADGDGRIDRLELGFSAAVDIVDPGGAADGLPCLVPGGGRSIVAADYSASAVTALTLLVVPGSAVDTGSLIGVTYAPAGGSSILDAGTALGLVSGAAGPPLDGAAPVPVLNCADPPVVPTPVCTVQVAFGEPVTDLLPAGLTAVNAVVASVARTDSGTFEVTLAPVLPGAVQLTVLAGAVDDAAGNPARLSTMLGRLWFPDGAATQFAVTAVTVSGRASGVPRRVHVDGVRVPIVGGAWNATVEMPGADPKTRQIQVGLSGEGGNVLLPQSWTIETAIAPIGGGG